MDSIKHKNELRSRANEITGKIVNDRKKESMHDLHENELWTKKYKPSRFYELLTDELTNRNILTWLTSWRKDENSIQPGTRFSKYASRPQQKSKGKYFSVKKDGEFKPREYNYPTVVDPEDLDYEDKRILIIGGDPGTGKSVLANTLAKHSGYHIEVLNAGDEIATDEVIDRIAFATQNQTLSNFQNKEEAKKPTCLIVDGIDPDTQSGQMLIKLLENYIRNGTIKNIKKTSGEVEDSDKPSAFKLDKGKVQPKDSKQKTKEIKRPIICICKNIYNRHLIPLKKLGLTFKIRKPDSKKLLTRLTEILEKEEVVMESVLLKKLIIETNHDITSCLNILKYLVVNLDYEECGKDSSGHVRLAKVIKETHLYDAEGQFKFKKDMLSSVFDSWDKIMKVRSRHDPRLTIAKIKRVVAECDNISKFNEGLYHNYSRYSYYDENMEKSLKFVTSLADHDINQTFINRTQNYLLEEANYLPAATYHVYLSTTGKVQNEFPKIFSELYMARKETNEAITTIREGPKDKVYKPSPAADINADSLKSDSFQTIKLLSRSQMMKDIIPYVLKLFRPANIIKQSLLTEQQYKQLSDVLALLKTFPIELVKKLTFNETQTRSDKMGLHVFGSKSKHLVIL